MDLMKLLLDQFGDDIVKGLAGNLNIGASDAKSGLSGILPSLLGGLINKADTRSGAEELFDVVSKNHGGGILDDLAGAFGKTGDNSLLNIGSALLPMILGGSSQSNSIFDIAGRVLGGGSGRSKSLMSMAAPILLGFIGKQIKGKGVQGLINLLMGQKEHVAKAAHPELASALGFNKWTTASSSSSHSSGSTSRETSSTTTTTTARREEETSGGGGFPKWLWPLLLLGLLGLLLFGLLRGCGGDADGTKKVGTKDTKKIEQRDNRTKTNTNTNVKKGANTNVNTNKGVNTTTSSTTTTTGGTTTTTSTTRPGNNAGGTTTTSGSEAASTTTNSGVSNRPGTSGGASYTGFAQQFSTAKSGSTVDFGNLSPDGKALSAAAKTQLDQVADIMKANPAMNIMINGHNKDHGNKVENTSARAASKIRAKLVEAHLVTKGIKPNRMKTKSQGHDMPVSGAAPTDDKNKRISISIL